MMSVLTVDKAEPQGLPGPGTWHLDPWHTSANFIAVNRAAGRVRGRFNRISGSVHVAQEPPATTVQVIIDAASVSTGVAARDAHLKSPDFLDAAAFPELRFTGGGLTLDPNGRGVLAGELTVHGVTKPVALAVTWLGRAPDPFSEDGEHVAFTATTSLSLSEHGIEPPKLPGLPIKAVGDRIAIELEVVLLPYDPAPLLRSIPTD